MTAPRPTRPPAQDEALRRGHLDTAVSRPVAIGLSAVFLIGLYAIAIGQTVVSVRRGNLPGLPDRPPTRQQLLALERELETASAARAAVRPRLQELVSRLGGFGNAQVVIGRDGWLFYAPGLASLTGPGFLDEDVHRARRRAARDAGEPEPHPDPRPAILDLHRMLAARGIRLVLFPVADKAAVEARWLHGRGTGAGVLPVATNPDHPRLVAELRAAGVAVFDPTPASIDTGEPARYLRQDTHWTPDWMERSAAALARFIAADLPPDGSVTWRRRPARVARPGDLVDMLQLPPDQTLFAPQAVTIHPVEDEAGRPWAPREDADVLLLGDSFTSIFTAGPMGWGQAAGLGPQLAAALGRHVDVIARNDAGAHATRELLARELAAGRDRLAGKKVVIWQLAARELAVGDWRPVSWPAADGPGRQPPSFFVPPPAPIVVSAVVADASPVPRPGDVPYKDHIRALRLQDLPGGREALAYVYSMRDHAWTAAARLRPGARVKVRLRSWAAVAPELEAINRSELADEALLAAEPAWAELETGGTP